MPDATAAGPEAIAAVSRVLGHTVSDPQLLRRAMTHASRCGAQATLAHKLREANERLEFLGDAFLGAAIAQILFEKHPGSDEGHLSRLRSHLASRATLARSLEATELLALCLVGSQMGADPQQWPDSVKANLAESLLAAIWLDAGWGPLRTAVERLLADSIADPLSGREDARMQLQTWALEHFKRLPDYVCERSGGTDHQPEFAAQVSIGPHQASGRGGGRRRAEGAAAQALLDQLGVERPLG